MQGGAVTLRVDVRGPASAFAPPLPHQWHTMSTPAHAPARNDSSSSFKFVAGRISADAHDWKKPMTLTLKEAQDVCAKTTQCNALTFAGKAALPTGAQQIWLTSKTVVAPRIPGACPYNRTCAHQICR